MVRGGRLMAAVTLAAAVAACGKGGAAGGRGAPADAAKFSGMYESDTLPSESGRGRLAKLAVGSDTAAALSVEFVGLGVTYHPGRWSSDGDLITLQPTKGDGTPNENPLTWRLEGTRLVPVTWDHNIYGAQGLPLTKQPKPAAAPARPDSNPGAAR